MIMDYNHIYIISIKTDIIVPDLQLPRQRSAVAALFSGQFRSVLRCKGCGAEARWNASQVGHGSGSRENLDVFFRIFELFFLDFW